MVSYLCLIVKLPAKFSGNAFALYKSPIEASQSFNRPAQNFVAHTCLRYL